MNKLLHHFKNFHFVLLLLVFSGNVNGQCSITSSTNSSSLSCGTSPLNNCGGILYIGNGTDAMTLTMNANLDLTCLGAIRFIIKKDAFVDFSTGNFDLRLAAGSSIEVESGGQLGATSNCSASDLIKIGDIKVASCTGNNALTNFPDLVASGGYSSITATASPSSFCNSGSSTITATANPSSGATYKWYTVPSGGSPVFEGNPFSTGTIASTATYYVEAAYTSPAYTTIRRAVTVTVNPLPTITTQPIDQLDCEGASVNFMAVATGTGLTYTWQRKKPTDASFITIPVEGNISYPSVGKIKIDNVGSSQSPSGTQYQVVITTSSGCSVTSSAATLLVNEITGISPSATTVTQCNGTNYSYTVSTSTPPPGSVVSYQWKSSVTSGVWNNVVDGTHFSGANSATLNILNGTPAQSAEYKVQVIFTSSGADCNVTTALNRQITFLPEVTPPVATITQPTCTLATGSVVLSGLPASGTWTLTRSGTSTATTTGTGTTTTISGLATGTYNFTVSDGTCTSLASADVVINAQPQTPSTPTIDSYTLPTFADNDGTITLDNLPAGAWVGNQIKDGGTPTAISGTGSPYTITGLSYGSYEFEVVGVCVSSRSSATALTTVPYTPVVSPATAINCSGFTTNWPATPTATSYLLDVSTVSNFATFVPGYQDRNVGNVLTYPVTGMPAGTLYYRIRAQNASLISLYSATVTVVTLANLSAVNVTPTGAQTICDTGTGSLLTATETGGGVITGRQWGKRSVSGGAIAAIGGQTGATFSPTGAGLGTGTWYVVCTSTPTCGSAMTSNEVVVTVSPPSVGGTLSPANTDVCSGAWNSNVITLSGYTGNIIRWESSTDNFAGGTITTIANTGNTQTIGTHTVDTYYRAVVQSGTCGIAYSTAAKITVYPTMADPTGISVDGGAAYPPSGSGISHCANTSTVFSIAPVANASSYTWVIPTGWTVVSGQGTTTLTAITGTNAQSANIEVYASNTGCGNTNRNYLYLYLNPSSAPVVSLTQPTCAVATGTITVTSPAPASGITYTLVGTNPVVGAVTNATGVFSGLAAGDYKVTVNNGTFVSVSGIINDPLTNCASTTNVTINAVVTTTYNGTSWSSTPDINKIGIISGSGTISTNTDLCSCTVNMGVNAVVASGVTLKLQDKLTVNGSLTFNDTASLVQINDVPNSGNINYIRTTNTAVLSTDYTYWSSPVSPQTIGDFSPKTLEGMMFSYDSNIDDWKQEYLSTSMVAGFGYIVRGPEPSVPPTPPSPYTATFEGVPNNGDYSIPAIADRSYLLGNPYPSALDADTFLNANSSVLDGTLYFWTHNTQIGVGVSDPGTGIYAYSGDDYATYNQTGGTAAAPSGGAIPTGKIASGQGFFASTKTSISGATIVYNNNMRVGVGGITGSNSQFFKTRNPKEKAVNPIEKNRVWLNLTNTQGAFKQTLVGYITNATNDYDSRFDGESFDGNEFVDFYSINADKNLTIQGRALPFDENDEVPLGFRTTIDGTFTINIDQVDGLLVEKNVFIEDRLTNTIADLKNGNYTFSTTAGTFNERFVLRYKDNTSSKTLGLDETDANDGIIVLYSNNYKTLIIRNNGDSIISSVTLFNMAGQHISVWDVKDREQTSIQIPIKDTSSGIYVVKVKTTLGESSKKIVIR